MSFPIPKSTLTLLEIASIGICIILILALLNSGRSQKYEIRLLILGLLMIMVLCYLFFIQPWEVVPEELDSSIVSACQCQGGGCACDQVEMFSDLGDTSLDGKALVEQTGPYSGLVLNSKDKEQQNPYNCQSNVYQGTPVPLHRKDLVRTNNNDCPEEYAFDGSGKVFDCQNISKPTITGDSNQKESLMMFSFVVWCLNNYKV